VRYGRAMDGVEGCLCRERRHSLIISIDAFSGHGVRIDGTTYSRSEVQYRSLKELLTFAGSTFHRPVQISSPYFRSPLLNMYQPEIERIDDDCISSRDPHARLRAQAQLLSQTDVPVLITERLERKGDCAADSFSFDSFQFPVHAGQMRRAHLRSAGE